MKFPVLFLALFVATISTTFGGPKMDAVASISIRDSQFVVVRVLREPVEIDTLLSCFRRAKKGSASSDRKAFPYKIDIDDRWLYDADRGEFMLLSKTKQPIYRLSEADRVSVNALIVQKEKKADPVGTDNDRAVPGRV